MLAFAHYKKYYRRKMRIKITLKQLKTVLTKAELKFAIIFQIGIIDRYEIAQLLKNINPPSSQTISLQRVLMDEFQVRNKA